MPCLSRRSSKSICLIVEIGWVVKERCAGLLEGNPYLDRIYKMSGSPALPELIKLRRELRRAAYDVAWDMQGLSLSGLITQMSEASRRIGLDLNREGNRWFLNEPMVPARVERQRHAIDILRGFLPTLGIPPETVWPPLCYLADGIDLPDAFLQFARSGRSDTVALNVGASSVYKQWSAEHWSQLVAKIAAAGLKISADRRPKRCRAGANHCCCLQRRPFGIRDELSRANFTQANRCRHEPLRRAYYRRHRSNAYRGGAASADRRNVRSDRSDQNRPIWYYGNHYKA